jgi:hypothetical protein
MDNPGRRKRSYDEDNSSSDSGVAGPRHSGRAPVPSEKLRILSESPPPAARRAKKTKKSTSSHTPSELTATNSPKNSSLPPTPPSIMSTIPVEVRQPSSVTKQGCASTAAHDINTFFYEGEGGENYLCKVQVRVVIHSLLALFNDV